jgi:hypothetical protein
MYTVKRLKKLIENLPDDTLIVTNGRDHSYRSVSAQSDWIGYDVALGTFSEWHGKEHASEDEQRVKALIIN